MDRPILLILAGDARGNAVDAAFRHARALSKPLRVLQVLASDLYHYGHHDLVATRHSKRQFLLHIREEVLSRGAEEIRALEHKASEMGISLEIQTVESEDAVSAALSEASKGYETVFLPQQPRRLFPLFKRSMADLLRKKTSSTVVAC